MVDLEFGHTSYPVPLASLFVRQGEHRGRRLPVRSAAVTIGRADTNDVVIADPSVSATHATLERRDGLWILTNRASVGVTFIDGEPVMEETPLAPGATVQFGAVTLLFEPYDGPSESAPVSVPVERPARAMRPQPEPPRGLPGWLVAAIFVVAAAGGAAVGFVLLR